MNWGNSKKNNLVYRESINKYYAENDKIDINDVNSPRGVIANQIKKNSVVLDVGCNQGTLGIYLKNNLNCKVYGIEVDKEAVKIAKQKKSFEDIYIFSVENDNDKIYKEFFEKKIKFDYIIFADVLEHLNRPDKIIFEFQKLLKDGGEILVSIPNIAHYDIIRGLFNDQFNYCKVGILDNTHLRFFTKKSFVQFIDDINDYYHCNLDLKHIGGSTIIPDYSPKYSELNKVIYLKENINILQNVFSIKKTKSKNLKGLNQLLLEEDIDVFEILNQKIEKLNRYENSKVIQILRKIRIIIRKCFFIK